VVILDSLNALATFAPQSLSAFLSTIIAPNVSLVAVYHSDVPVVLPKTINEYEPHHLTVLCHLATAILKLSSLEQEIKRQKARNRSLQEPEWGLREGREGVILGLKGTAKSADDDGLVVEMELRKRSGRAITEKFVLLASKSQGKENSSLTKVSLLSDHPLFAARDSDASREGRYDEDSLGPETTFNLGLTDKQRKDREGIVLPYFDAQTDIGSGDGGRILYEMGREDDFDDEEDEI
jgi:elongator complex protein 5